MAGTLDLELHLLESTSRFPAIPSFGGNDGNQATRETVPDQLEQRMD